MNVKRAFLIMAAAMLIPGYAMAQEVFTATFVVTKDFDDNNPMDVEVTITCNNGLPLEQSAMISESEDVAFVVTELSDIDEVECAVTEDSQIGYTPSYRANGGTPRANFCEFRDRTG